VTERTQRVSLIKGEQSAPELAKEVRKARKEYDDLWSCYESLSERYDALNTEHDRLKSALVRANGEVERLGLECSRGTETHSVYKRRVRKQFARMAWDGDISREQANEMLNELGEDSLAEHNATFTLRVTVEGLRRDDGQAILEYQLEDLFAFHVAAKDSAEFDRIECDFEVESLEEVDL
jgi:chromosome segregation ATPase